MQELPPELSNPEINRVGASVVCYHCGYKGHLASACKYKSAKCHLCHNLDITHIRNPQVPRRVMKLRLPNLKASTVV